MKQELSRRAIVAGAAALSLPAPANAGRSDPHRAWLDAWRRAEDHSNALYEACNGDRHSAGYAAFREAQAAGFSLYERLCSTPATTLDGIAAQYEALVDMLCIYEGEEPQVDAAVSGVARSLGVAWPVRRA